MEGEIFKTEVVKLDYDRNYNLVYIEWFKNPALEQYKEPFQFLIHDFSQKEKVWGIISDIRNQGVVGPQHRKWLYEEATPHAQEKGLKYYGIVMDSNVFKTYYVNTMLKLVGNKDGVVRKVFHEFEKCDSWIKDNLSELTNA